MDVCPICRAACKGDETCHRCKSDLGRFRAIEQEALKELEAAVMALKGRDYAGALSHGKRSCSLKRSRQGILITGHARNLARRAPSYFKTA